MNLSHYIVGYFHYFGALLAIISQAQGFVRGSVPELFQLDDITLRHYTAIGLFLYAWYNQFISNLILASLRKNNSGEEMIQFLWFCYSIQFGNDSLNLSESASVCS